MFDGPPGRWRNTGSGRLAHPPAQRTPPYIVLLQPPSIAERIECWGIRSMEKGRISGDTGKVKHLVFSKKQKEIFDGRYVDVIKHKKGSMGKMGIERQVLKVGKWIAMRTIYEDQIQGLVKRVTGNRHLGRSDDEVNGVSIEQRRLPHSSKTVSTIVVILGEHLVVAGQMGQ